MTSQSTLLGFAATSLEEVSRLQRFYSQDKHNVEVSLSFYTMKEKIKRIIQNIKSTSIFRGIK